jgi:hypothetical protein
MSDITRRRLNLVEQAKLMRWMIANRADIEKWRWDAATVATKFNESGVVKIPITATSVRSQAKVIKELDGWSMPGMRGPRQPRKKRQQRLPDTSNDLAVIARVLLGLMTSLGVTEGADYKALKDIASESSLGKEATNGKGA